MNLKLIAVLMIAIAALPATAQNNSGVAAAITGAAITYGIAKGMEDRPLGKSVVVFKALGELTPADAMKLKPVVQEYCPNGKTAFSKPNPGKSLGDIFAEGTSKLPRANRVWVQVTQTPVGDRGCSVYTFHVVEK